MDNELTVSFVLDEEQPIDCIFRIDATTFDYEALDKKPKINGNELIGDKTGEELGLADSQALTDLEQRVTEDIDGLASLIDSETQARETEDTNINNRVDSLEQNIQSEATTRENNDTLLQNNINTLYDTVTSNYDVLSTLISTETTNRTQADNNLQQQINQKQPVGDYATNERVNDIASDVALNTNQIQVAFETMADDKAELKQDIENLASDIDKKQNKLIAGTNIVIDEDTNTISSTTSKPVYIASTKTLNFDGVA